MLSFKQYPLALLCLSYLYDIFRPSYLSLTLHSPHHLHPLSYLPISSLSPSLLPPLSYSLSATPSLPLYQQAILVELHPSYRQDRHFRHAARMTGKIYMPLRSQQRYAPSPPTASLPFHPFFFYHTLPIPSFQLESHLFILPFPPFSLVTPASNPMPCLFLSSHSHTFQYSSSSYSLIYFLFVDSSFIFSLPFLIHL